MSKTSTETLAGENRRLWEEHRNLLFPCLTPLYREPLALTRGQGVWVRDADDREYLDLFAGILTTSLGHCHPEVTARVTDQIQRLGHTSTLYVAEAQIQAARRLASISPGRLQTSFFTNSGTEAVETAIMLAQLYTGRSEIVALRLGYSGRSSLATNLTAHSVWRPLPTTFAPIKHALAPYPYRSPFQGSESEQADRFAADVQEVIETTTSGKPAAFFAETIQGLGGYIVPPSGYFRRVAEIIRGYGGLFISDEVQTGFGRTGDAWFGIEHAGVEPDIMVMAKGIANGYPVGATITRPDIAEAWKAKTISTYGGNPVCMAAADATLEIMQREDTPGRSGLRGRQLETALNRLFAEFSWIGEVRGQGLMRALELVEDRQTKTPSPEHARALLEATREEGLLVGLGGQQGHVIRIGPSMLISEAEMDEAMERLHRACRRVDSGR